jgi:hypothetical protein
VGDNSICGSAREDRLGRCHQLHDHRMILLQVPLDRRDHGGQLHGKQHLAEETLARPFQTRTGGGLRARVQRLALEGVDHVCRLERGSKVGVDDLPCPAIGVVDLDLGRCQFMAQHFVFDAGETERASRIEAKRLQVTRDQFHRGDAALTDVGDEGFPVREGGFRSPEAEAHGIGEVVDV